MNAVLCSGDSFSKTFEALICAANCLIPDLHEAQKKRTSKCAPDEMDQVFPPSKGCTLESTPPRAPLSMARPPWQREKENRLTWCRGKRASCRLLLVEKKWETDQNPEGCRLRATIPRTGSLTGGSPVAVQPEHAIHEYPRWQDTPLTPHFWWSARYPNGTPQSATRMEKA